MTELTAGASVRYKKGARYHDGVVRKVEPACVQLIGSDKKFHTIARDAICKVYVPGSKGGAS